MRPSKDATSKKPWVLLLLANDPWRQLAQERIIIIIVFPRKLTLFIPAAHLKFAANCALTKKG